MKSYLKFLSRNKWYTLINILGLSLSLMFILLIGAFAWQETHLDDFHRNVERIYALGYNEEGEISEGSHWRMQFKLRDRYPEIENSTMLFFNKTYIDVPGNESLYATYFVVDSTFYDLFDFAMIRGDGHKALTRPFSAIVTPQFGRKLFGNSDPVGRSFAFNDSTELMITAVMAPMTNTMFVAPDRKPVDFIVGSELLPQINPGMCDEQMSSSGNAEVFLLAREGVDLTSRKKDFQDYMAVFFWVFGPERPSFWGTESLEIIPLKDIYLGEFSETSNHVKGNPRVIRHFSLLGFVILIFAVMNYINLTVALSGSRAKEMAVRRLNGATGLAIGLKMMSESLILVLISFVIGLVLAFLAVPYVSMLLQTPVSLGALLAPQMIAAIAAVIVVIAVLSGLIPAFLLSKSRPIDVVSGKFRRQTKMVLSKIFIVIQNVITMSMIAVSITMFLQIRHLVNAPLGYETEGIATVEFSYDQDYNKFRIFAEEVGKLPCIEAVGKCNDIPLGRGNNNTVSYSDEFVVGFQEFRVDSDFLDIFGIKILKGGEKPVGNFVNHRLLGLFNLDEDATSFPVPPYQMFNGTINGIVDNFHLGSILDEDAPIIVRKEIFGEDNFYRNIVLKVVGDENEAWRKINEVYKSIFGFDYENEHPFVEQQISEIFGAERNQLKIVAVFTFVAIIISILGLVAMSTYYVGQRANEIAVRKVMGSTSAGVLRRLVWSFLAYVAIGFVIAVPLIYIIMGDWLSNYSYHISLSWWIFALAGAFGLLISFIAVVIQSRRAANANPVKALYQN